NEVCIFVYEIDDDKIVKSREGNTEYLLKDLVYLLRVEDGDKAHYIYIKNVAHFFNLCHNCIEGDHRYCPICSNQVSLKEYDRHISFCYEYSKNSTLLRLPEEGRVMEFTNYKNQLE
ncbi:MAG: hypothetical protein ACKPKO_05510, partial [Candidatus Fonsibacter sp.]